ncbi:MAG: MltA domain-containing protein [Desulfobacteraceae bacterium]|nr:MltA domain-containing protein [Desulfobacteraceae bacterium]
MTAPAIAVVLVIFFFARPVPCAEMIKVSEEQIPVFSDDLKYADLVSALEQSIAYYERVPGNRKFAFGRDAYNARELAAGLRRFKNFVENKPSEDQLGAFLRENARIYQFAEQGIPVRVLLTGYYEPVLDGSRKKTDEFKYPVYCRPRDLVKIDLSEFGITCSEKFIIGRYTGKGLVQYYDRRTIETEKVLESRADTIAWTDDPINLFFLHVQGSGMIKMRDGDVLRVHYSITNGRPYRSIGEYLIDEGKISRQEMSMQAIARYIKKNPSEMEDIFFYNPRYVFFKVSNHGPTGSTGAELTPGRSAALDRKVTPPGALLFVSGRKPACAESVDIKTWEPFSRFMCSQDAGAAIQGQKRADIFWGAGDYAEAAAGHMKHRGYLYFIVVEPDSESF